MSKYRKMFEDVVGGITEANDLNEATMSSADHTKKAKWHEEQCDAELKKVGSKLPDSWDAGKLRTKLASHPKYATALKHLDKSEHHFSQAAKKKD